MKKLKATIEFVFDAEDTLPLESINNHLRLLLKRNLHDRLELINIDSLKVEDVKSLMPNRDVEREANSLLRSMEMNTWWLWTPDFKKTVQAVILHKVGFEDEEQEFNFDGIDIDKLNLEKALKSNDDFGEESKF